MRKRLTLEDRFWLKVKKNSGCWLWSGSKGAAGYGNIVDKGKCLSAHRVSWELHNGKIPSGEGYHGVCVLHKCDVRLCVRPDHLFLGSQHENIADKESKRRGNHPKGSSQYLAKLSELKVLEIRNLWSLGWSLAALAKKYRVNAGTIWHVVNRKTWKHVS